MRSEFLNGGSIQISPRPARTAPQTPDEFDRLMMSAASFDLDSPVEAQAEFDPPVAQVGGRVVYRIEVSALDESLSAPEKLPTPKGLELRAGGRGQTYQPGPNMKLRPMTTLIYRGVVTNTGTFTIPAFNLMAYGKSIRVPATTLTAVPAGEAGQSEPPRLLLDLPEGDCYAGQLLRAQLILPIPPDGSVAGLSQPHITGDFIFAEQFSTGARPETLEREGKMFQAYVQDVVITPLRAGEQDLIGQAHCYVLRRNPRQTNILQSSSLLVDSDPVRLTVKPLPAEGVLAGFTGAVGHFQIDPPRLFPTELRAGEPVTLTLIVRGDGNIGRLLPPPLPSSPDWQGFPPVGELLPAAVIQQRGYASFKYTWIPLRDSITASPAIPFSYFDPRKKAYVDLTVPPAPIKVNPGSAGTVAQADAEPPASNPEFDNASNEKEPVLSGLSKTPGASLSSLKPTQQQWWFAVWQLLPAAALGGLWAWDRRRRYPELHPEVALKRRARRGLRRQLRIARRAAQARDAGGFVVAGADALREACAPHTAANPGALVCADVLQEVRDVEQKDRTGEMIRRVFAAADALRFGGPVKDGSELLALQPDLEQVLEELRARL